MLLPTGGLAGAELLAVVVLLAAPALLAACRGSGVDAAHRDRGPAPAAAKMEAPKPAARRGPKPSDELPPASSVAAERVRLVAHHELGVPLHPSAGSNAVSGRLPGGSWVSIVDRSEDGRWLKVLSRDGLAGWITRRYAPRAQRKRAVELPAGLIWKSPAACQRQLAELVGRRTPGRVRLMSYNVRWFPDGKPGKRPSGTGTDVAWLACALAASNVDIVALQEIKATNHARHALGELIEALDRHTGGEHRVELDRCPIESAQHVGVLYDAKRVRASHFREFASLNPHRTPCQDQLRPGFGGYFEFPGGLDLHLISVHLKSGHKRRDHDLRLRSLAGIPRLVNEAQATQKDDDLVIAGDMNSMGCRSCSPGIDARSELALFRTRLRGQEPAWTLSSPLCTEYYRGEPSLLDHFAVSGSLARQAITSEVSGFCGALSCQSLGNRPPPAAYTRLSDHCPLILELPDSDDDP